MVQEDLELTEMSYHPSVRVKDMYHDAWHLVFFFFFGGMESLTGLGITNLVKLTGQQVPGIHLCSPFQYWDYKHMPLHLAYNMGSEDGTRVFGPVGQVCSRCVNILPHICKEHS